MKVPKRGAPRPVVPIELPKGVVLHARRLDSFEAAEVLAAVEADMAAIVAGEAPEHDWAFGAEREGKLRASNVLQQVVKGWMRGVLTAVIAVSKIDGLEEDVEGAAPGEGPPATPSFELFAALFESEIAETRFRTKMIALDAGWSAEGNVSGRGRSGDSAAGSRTAKPADPSTPPAPEA